jgi:hypothetical protein
MLIDGKCYADGTFRALKAVSDEKVHSFFE